MRFSKLRCENFPQTKKHPSWCPSSDEPAIFHGMACRDNEKSEIVMDPQFPFGILNVVRELNDARSRDVILSPRQSSYKLCTCDHRVGWVPNWGKVLGIMCGKRKFVNIRIASSSGWIYYQVAYLRNSALTAGRNRTRSPRSPIWETITLVETPSMYPYPSSVTHELKQPSSDVGIATASLQGRQYDQGIGRNG